MGALIRQPRSIGFVTLSGAVPGRGLLRGSIFRPRILALLRSRATASPKGAPMSLQDRANRLAPYVLSIVRIVVALLFFEHGLSKMVGFPTGEARVLFTLSWYFRRHRIRHRRAAHGRALDPHDGLHRLRRDGLCLFPVARAAEFLPDRQPRRGRHPVLLYFPLHRLCRRRAHGAWMRCCASAAADL